MCCRSNGWVQGKGGVASEISSVDGQVERCGQAPWTIMFPNYIVICRESKDHVKGACGRNEIEQ